MFVAFLFNPGDAKDLKYFSNFKPGPLIFGPESVVTDFVTIANDPGIDLPDKFTICSSLFIEVMTTAQNIIEILKENGTHWFSISYDPRKETTTREEFFVCVQSGYSNFNISLKTCNFVFYLYRVSHKKLDILLEGPSTRIFGVILKCRGVLVLELFRNHQNKFCQTHHTRPFLLFAIICYCLPPLATDFKHLISVGQL